jgi:hypothetical protein
MDKLVLLALLPLLILQAVAVAVDMMVDQLVTLVVMVDRAL